MYQPDNSKVKNFYNQFTNPSGKAPSTSKGTSIKDLFMGMQSPAVSNPNASKFDIRNIPDAGMSKPTPNTIGQDGKNFYSPPPALPQKTTPAPQGQMGGSSLFQGAGASQQTPAPQGASAGSRIEKLLNPDGSLMSDEEYVASVKSQMKGLGGGGDIGTYAATQFMGGEKSAEQLANEARQFANARGDIASGTTDPYGIASKSGIAYSPEELKAIENATAGIYDPALTTAISKKEAKDKADAEAAKWEQELEKMAKQHDYDLEKMKMDQKFQYGLAAYKAALDNSSAGVDTTAGGALTTQPGYDKLTTLQRRQADSLNNLTRSLQEYYDYYDKNPGMLGGYLGNTVGADSGELSTMLNSVIFAAAQAEGTGALQKADKDVITDMIPDPTSFRGAVGSFFRGGKDANLSRIKNQIDKYSANLANYGLTPTAPITAGQPESMELNGQILYLQPDGTYE